jgi:hypothetical protein
MTAEPLTPEQRKLRARIAVHESWANTEDRTARTEPGRLASPASVDYWLDKVDPDHALTEAERLKRAESKRQAYMARLAFKSAKVRAAARRAKNGEGGQ